VKGLEFFKNLLAIRAILFIYVFVVYVVRVAVVAVTASPELGGLCTKRAREMLCT
jgi:hypothetical protein